MSAIPPPLSTAVSSASILSVSSVYTQSSEHSAASTASTPPPSPLLDLICSIPTHDADTLNGTSIHGATVDSHSMPITPPDNSSKQFIEDTVKVVITDLHPITSASSDSVTLSESVPGAQEESTLVTMAGTLSLGDAFTDEMAVHSSAPPAPFRPRSPGFLGTPFSHPSNQPYEYPFPSPPLPSPPTIFNPDADVQLHVQVKVMGLMNPGAPPHLVSLPGKPHHSHSLPIIAGSRRGSPPLPGIRRSGSSSPPPQADESSNPISISPPSSSIIVPPSISTLPPSGSSITSAPSLAISTTSPTSSVSSTSPLAKMTAKLVENAQQAPMPPTLANALLERRRKSIDSAIGSDLVQGVGIGSGSSCGSIAGSASASVDEEMSGGIDIPAVEHPIASYSLSAATGAGDKKEKARRRSAGTGPMMSFAMTREAFAAPGTGGNMECSNSVSMRMMIDSSALMSRRRAESAGDENLSA